MELGVALVTSGALQPERWAGRGPDRARMRAAAGMQVLATWNMLGQYSHRATGDVRRAEYFTHY